LKSEHPASYPSPDNRDEMVAIPSRLIDEKISDESGTEATQDRVFAPAGLDNPFWN
jgi:hypothetical protein